MSDTQSHDAGPDRVRAWIDRAARRHPDKPYVVSVEDGRVLTYGALGRVAARMAAFLHRNSIGANDRVALFAGNSIEHVACTIATLAHGATICTVNVEMNRRHLDGIVTRLQPRLAIHDEEGRAAIAEGCDGSLPGLALGRVDAPAAGTLFGLLEAQEARTGAALAGNPRDDAVIAFTSGTGDRPKGVVLSFREQIGNVEPMIAGFGITRDDRIYDYRSFNWASAQLLGVLGSLSCGATLVMARTFSASRFFDDVRRHGVTVAAGNPTTINMLLAAAGAGALPAVPTLRFMTSSSAPLLAQEWRRFEERFGIPVAQGYGSSESAWIAVNAGQARRFGSVGRPIAYHRLAIVGGDGRCLPAGEIGEVEIGGWEDNAYRYLGEDGVARAASRGRMRTGDVGYLDADGFLFLTGREKELIIRGGVNISPVEIDGVLMQSPGIAEAATIGIPDAIWGEEVVSYVVPRPGATVSPDEVLRFCAAHLPAFKAPKRIVLREALPKSERGKLDRKALAAEWKAWGA
jgi:acyl-CoA synthetase (AMP-forming)/AMP-acid ligase II